MAVTIALANDNNHSISSTKKILSRQGELGEQITFSVPTALAATYGLAWIMVQQPDGQLYYIDNGSATGFDHATTDSFTYTLGDRDTMLSVGGQLGLQVVLRDAAPPAQTVEWRSRILLLTVEDSILSNTDSGGSLIDSLSSGTLNKLADIQYDSIADGDLLYRDTTTGKWRNVTLVDGANISHVLNKTTGELTLQATGNISTLASDLVYTDSGGYFTGSDGETIGQEIGASLELKAPLASPALTGTPTVPTAAVGTNTTQAASTAFVRAQIPLDAPLDLLAEYKVTGSAVTSIDFTGLDINTHKSYRIEFELINHVSNYVQYYIYINGDTTNSNYWAQSAVGSGGYMYPARANAPEFGFVNANGRIFGEILVSLCGGTPYLVVTNARFTQTALEVAMDAIAKTVGVANITKLTFAASVANSIAVGSKIRIYRGDV